MSGNVTPLEGLPYTPRSLRWNNHPTELHFRVFICVVYARMMQWRDMLEHTDGPGGTLDILIRLTIL